MPYENSSQEAAYTSRPAAVRAERSSGIAKPAVSPVQKAAENKRSEDDISLPADYTAAPNAFEGMAAGKGDSLAFPPVKPFQLRPGGRQQQGTMPPQDFRTVRSNGGVVQRLKFTIPHPKKSVNEPKEVDTAGDDWHYLQGWVDLAAETNREALRAFIVMFDRYGSSQRDTRLLMYAVQKFQQPLAPVTKIDGLGQRAANVGEGLIDAQRVDYANSSAYLGEGEGQLLSAQWQVDAEIFDQPNPREKTIRANIRYGEGLPNRGRLLYVNKNHYIVITPTDAGQYDFIDLQGRKYNRSDLRTVADGNCLIDGLYIIRHNRKATPENIKAARKLLAANLSRETIINILTIHIADYMEGIAPALLGPEVSGILESDPELMGMYQAGVRRRQEEARKKEALRKENLKHVRSDKPKGAVLGLPGISYLGPTKSEVEDDEAIHRGEVEIEMHENIPYVRMYTAVPLSSTMKTSNTDTGLGTSDFKDIQQDVTTGKVIISSGQNSMLWVSGGRILRQLKWAEKYIVEHQEKSRIAKEDAAKTEKTAAELEKQIEGLDRSIVEPYMVQGLETQLDEARNKVKELTKAAAFHATVNKPIIRSFLIPLDTFNDISKRAVSEKLNGKAGNEGRTFNVDKHAEPNQFGVRGDDLGLLGKSAKPGSLVTYAYDTEEASKDKRSGEVRDAGLLRERLGIPMKELPDFSVWTEGGGFIDRKNLLPKANLLNMYYVTWLQEKEGTDTPAPHHLLSSDKAAIPFSVRKTQLAEFLKRNGIKGQDQAKEFMEQIVAPWANQAMIEHVMSEDYERIDKDENVKSVEKSTFATNAFGSNLDSGEARQKKMVETGSQLDTLYKEENAPQKMIDYLITQLGELKPYFEKISAKSEGYQFYDHAQMVLGQFMKIASKDEDRLISRTAMAKMILFHDMEKTNSKSQYGTDPEGEHQLTLDVMSNYRDLWSKKEFAIVSAIVSGDPIGEYMNKGTAPEKAFMEIITLARKAGIAPADYRKFFIEFHQFYQADFSSYSTKSSYVKKGEETATPGKKGFEEYFVEGGRDGFEKTSSGERFKYSEEDRSGSKNYEARFATLDAMFASEDVIMENIRKNDFSLRKISDVPTKEEVLNVRKEKEAVKLNLQQQTDKIVEFLKTYLKDKDETTVEFKNVKAALRLGFDIQVQELLSGKRKPKKGQAEKYMLALKKLGFKEE
jgi:hypothetical protein